MRWVARLECSGCSSWTPCEPLSLNPQAGHTDKGMLGWSEPLTGVPYTDARLNANPTGQSTWEYEAAAESLHAAASVLWIRRDLSFLVAVALSDPCMFLSALVCGFALRIHQV